MNKVSDILARKGTSLVTVLPDSTVLEALTIMAELNIGSVIVNDTKGNFIGVVSERDYSRKVVLKGKSSTETPVTEIMTVDLPRISANDSVDHCMKLMTDLNVRYLPVFDNGELSGIVSMSDVVKQTIHEQKETISHLESYIHSNL